jgi:hypothetical protein
VAKLRPKREFNNLKLILNYYFPCPIFTMASCHQCLSITAHSCSTCCRKNQKVIKLSLKTSVGALKVRKHHKLYCWLDKAQIPSYGLCNLTLTTSPFLSLLILSEYPTPAG